MSVGFLFLTQNMTKLTFTQCYLSRVLGKISNHKCKLQCVGNFVKKNIWRYDHDFTIYGFRY